MIFNKGTKVKIVTKDRFLDKNRDEKLEYNETFWEGYIGTVDRVSYSRNRKIFEPVLTVKIGIVPVDIFITSLEKYVEHKEDDHNLWQGPYIDVRKNLSQE